MKFFQEIKKYSPEEIRRIRNKCNLSQKDLSKYLGVSAKSVEYWENGSRIPTAPICRLLFLLEISITTNKHIDSTDYKPLLPFEIPKPPRHFLHNRTFYCSQIGQEVIWKDLNNNLYVIFKDEGKTVKLQMPQRFRNNRDEEPYWIQIGEWEIDNYLKCKKFDAIAEELTKNGKILLPDAR